MGNQIITQPQTFKTNAVVVGSAAGAAAVSGLTVYGDISASGTVYGVITRMEVSYNGNGNDTSTYALTNYTNNTSSSYLVFVDGVSQPPDAFTVSVPNLTFTGGVTIGSTQKLLVQVIRNYSAPASTIPISLRKSTYTQPASPGTVTLSPGKYSADAENHLVFFDGVQQEYGVDYTISGSTLSASTVEGTKISVIALL
jgi:hypothetical protein